jgi:hypothetical protein
MTKRLCCATLWRNPQPQPCTAAGRVVPFPMRGRVPYRLWVAAIDRDRRNRSDILT